MILFCRSEATRGRVVVGRVMELDALREKWRECCCWAGVDSVGGLGGAAVSGEMGGWPLTGATAVPHEPGSMPTWGYDWIVLGWCEI